MDENQLNKKLKRLEERIEQLENLKLYPVTSSSTSLSDFLDRELAAKLLVSLKELRKSFLQMNHSILNLDYQQPLGSKGFEDVIPLNLQVGTFDSWYRPQVATELKFDLNHIRFDKLDFPIDEMLTQLTGQTISFGNALGSQQDLLKEVIRKIEPAVRRMAEEKVQSKTSNNAK